MPDPENYQGGNLGGTTLAIAGVPGRCIFLVGFFYIDNTDTKSSVLSVAALSEFIAGIRAIKNK